MVWTQMATCCSQSLAIVAPETSSCSSASSRVSSDSVGKCSSSSVASVSRGVNLEWRWRKGHMGTTFVLPECGAVVCSRKGKSTGLVVEAARRVASGRSYVLSSTLKIEEGNEEQVTALCKGVLHWAAEKQKEKRSGIEWFECNVDAFEKNVLHFWERYESFTTMNDVRASPEHTQFMMDVRPFLTGPVGLACYEYKDGQIGHMMNPIGTEASGMTVLGGVFYLMKWGMSGNTGPKGEGGLDDATGQSGSKQQSSVINQGLGDTGDREQWGITDMLAKISGKGTSDKPEGWSFKTLFGGKK